MAIGEEEKKEKKKDLSREKDGERFTG